MPKHTLLIALVFCAAAAFMAQSRAAEQDAGSAPAPATLSDTERALLAVMEKRNDFWPYSANFDVARAAVNYDVLDVQVRMLGEAQTADGPRKLAVVRIKAEASGFQVQRTVVGHFVLYFDRDMKLLEHHNHGCGSELRLDGNVIHFSGRTFDLGTRAGLEAFKLTANWC